MAGAAMAPRAMKAPDVERCAHEGALGRTHRLFRDVGAAGCIGVVLEILGPPDGIVKLGLDRLFVGQHADVDAGEAGIEDGVDGGEEVIGGIDDGDDLLDDSGMSLPLAVSKELLDCRTDSSMTPMS
jgi:hypothetical protein